jgi:nucleotidyltransferase substrate binding protein (TIGR01987 family)
MERVKVRYELFEKASHTLRTALTKFNDLHPTDYFYQEVRDSIIQRFEYSMDTFWKFLKEYIEVYHGINPIGSPKAIMKLCLDLNLIHNNEYSEFIEMVNDRNLTSHAYNISLAEDISSSVPHYYQLMQTVAQRIKLK